MADSAAVGVSDPVHEPRRHSRHQWIARVLLRLNQGKTIAGTSVEISQGGMSAVFLGTPLAVGECVQLYPIWGFTLRAEVRHIYRNILGFQFLELKMEEEEMLARQCQRLPEFKTMLDI